ncbi:MAG: octanoyl-[GcvH]:protein N-octanoyltransferase [Paraglaciecola sp.]|jgi:octanoyl-[GcvH]:protein N-octanoyltransferase
MNHLNSMPAQVPILGTEAALAHEKSMLERVTSGQVDQALSIWSAQQSIVVPKRMLSLASFAQASAKSAKEGWPVYARNTGGDATPQGYGVLNVSYAYAVMQQSKPSIKHAYHELCTPISDFISTLGYQPEYLSIPAAFCDGKYNIGVVGRKLAGTAQRWAARKDEQKTTVLFAHALILVNANISKGTSAINRLFKYCGQEQSVEEEAHINMADLVCGRKNNQLINELAIFLQPRYANLLQTRQIKTCHQTTKQEGN